MAHQVLWSTPVLEEFIRLGNLTKEEEEVMRMRVAGKSILEQSYALGMSVSTVNRIVSRCKVKYDCVQPFSTILPERVFSAEELYNRRK